MDTSVQADIATLGAQEVGVPCQPAGSGTLKCEACAGGCQLYNDLPFTPPQEDSTHKSTSTDRSHPSSVIGNERTHYVVPPGNNASLPDVILYRSGSNPFLFASVRHSPGQASWPAPVATNIPNDESNLNAGSLPDGRVYLVHNPVYAPKNLTAAHPEVRTSCAQQLAFK